jgi:hypothetical protein
MCNPEEGATQMYPYYRRIPIKHIAEKQDKMIIANKHYSLLKASLDHKLECSSSFEEIQLEYDSLAERYSASPNEEIIKEHENKINEQLQLIQYYASHIDHQVRAYNHNNTIVQQQILSVANNYSVMATHEQQLYYLQQQVEEKQRQLQKLTQELEDTQQKITYNNTILSSFNTMLENPLPFKNLMSAFLPV